MILYEALYNFMTWESSYETISIHKTELGARNALAKKVRRERERHNKMYNYDLEEMPYRFGEFEAWRVAKIALQE